VSIAPHRKMLLRELPALGNKRTLQRGRIVSLFPRYGITPAVLVMPGRPVFIGG
jgi:hypothetical protein